MIIGRQHHEEVVRREVVEARMNRWYNRLLNRHQDDPVSMYMCTYHYELKIVVESLNSLP